MRPACSLLGVHAVLWSRRITAEPPGQIILIGLRSRPTYPYAGTSVGLTANPDVLLPLAAHDLLSLLSKRRDDSCVTLPRLLAPLYAGSAGHTQQLAAVHRHFIRLHLLL